MDATFPKMRRTIDLTELHSRRRARAAELIEQAGLDAAAFVPGPNFYYLTGKAFHLMERPTILFVTRAAEIVAVIPELERLKWSEAFPDSLTFYWNDSDGFEGAFAAAGWEMDGMSVGVEGGRMRVFEYEALCRNFLRNGVRDADAALVGLRMSKDALEVECLERAIRISETSLSETIEGIRAGMAEKEVQNLLKGRMLENGADGFAFEPIVLTGAKAANPHGVPDETELLQGDALLFDFGAHIQGYNADITRTFFVGHVTDRHAAVYETVRSANERGREVAGPNMTAHDLDTIVTGVLQASDFAEMIVHKTGHGLGLDVHEAPHVMIGNRQQLVPGAVITIEPGLYGAEDVGVRIEDNVLIEESGSRSLTCFDRQLRIVG